MDIYYNPLDKTCKSITGGIKQKDNFTLTVFGNSNEPCLLILKRDEGEAQSLHMQRIAQGWTISLILNDPGLYFIILK